MLFFFNSFCSEIRSIGLSHTPEEISLKEFFKISLQECHMYIV